MNTLAPNLPLGLINAAAADTLVEVGWTQDVAINAYGSVCLTGALKMCSPEPGDWLLAREVHRTRDHAEEWNDTAGRTAKEVLDYLRSFEITDMDLADTFGSQWESVVRLVRRVAALTVDDLDGLAVLGNSSSDQASKAVRDLLNKQCFQDSIFEAQFSSTWNAVAHARAESDVAGMPSNRNLIFDTTVALFTRHLIDPYGLTQHDYNTLTNTWARVIGPVHPDDLPFSKGL